MEVEDSMNVGFLHLKRKKFVSKSSGTEESKDVGICSRKHNILSKVFCGGDPSEEIGL